jgi:hypothetical protein
MRLLLQARLDAPWSYYEAARYAELCKLELEAARAARAGKKMDETTTRMAEVAAIRREELELNIERIRDDLHAREGFSALGGRPRRKRTRPAPAT